MKTKITRTLALTLCFVLLASVTVFASANASSAQAIESVGFTTAQNVERRNLIVNVPEGVKAGDLLVAQIAVQPHDKGITVPAGWTQVANTANDVRQIVYTRVATANEPASYEWKFGDKVNSAGGILAYRGAGSSVRISSSSADSRTITARSIGNVQKGSVVLGFYAIKKSTNITGPSSMDTEYSFKINNGKDLAILCASGIQSATGVTGSKLATAGIKDKNVGHLIVIPAAASATPPETTPPPGETTPPETTAIESIGFTTAQNVERRNLVVNVPEGVKAGDLLVAQIAVQPHDKGITVPAGWTQVANTANDVRQIVYTRVATANEPASYEWKFGDKVNSAGGILAYRGASSSVRISSSSADSRTITARSIGNVQKGSVVLGFFAIKKSTSITGPSSMDTKYSFKINNGKDLTILCASGIQGATGMTGSKLATAGIKDKNVGHLIVIPAK